MSGQPRLILGHSPPLPWGGGLRCLFHPDVWDRIRRRVYRGARYRCEVCGQRGKMYCDGVWEFDERCGIIHLKGFVALCRSCHYCWHLDIAVGVEAAGKLDGEKLADHYCHVNGCAADAWRPAVEAAWERGERRDDLPWYVDLGELVESLPAATLAEFADVLVRSERDGDDTAGQGDATSEPAADEAQRDGDRGDGERRAKRKGSAAGGGAGSDERRRPRGKRKRARRRKPRRKGAR
ncbi:hypothetical protein ES707_09933 [subsurface metagenome]